MSYTLKINYDDNVITHENNALKVKLATGSSQHAEVRSDGLYAESLPGATGERYPDEYRSANGLTIGITSPDDATPVSRRAVAPSIVHRIFTCNLEDGSDIDLRGGLDILYPGDMYRVHTGSEYYYYLIIQTNGSSVTRHILVAQIPDNRTDVN